MNSKTGNLDSIVSRRGEREHNQLRSGKIDQVVYASRRNVGTVLTHAFYLRTWWCHYCRRFGSESSVQFTSTAEVMFLSYNNVLVGKTQHPGEWFLSSKIFKKNSSGSNTFRVKPCDSSSAARAAWRTPLTIACARSISIVVVAVIGLLGERRRPSWAQQGGGRVVARGGRFHMSDRWITI